MKKILMSVYDSKTESFGLPFPADTVAQAIRDFTDALKDEKSMLGRHPEDYSLFEVGFFDQSNGLIMPNVAPRQVITALECVKKEVK